MRGHIMSGALTCPGGLRSHRSGPKLGPFVGNTAFWAPHGKYGWHIIPVLEYCRCYTVYITKTHSECIIEAVELFPTEVTMPFLLKKYFATEAAKQLTHALLYLQPAGPFTHVGDEQTLALKHLVAILEGALPTHQQKKNPPRQSKKQ
jgi:hypothetical protein